MSSKSITEQVEKYLSKTELRKHDLGNGRWYEDEEGNLKISATSFNSVISMGASYDKWLMNNGADAIKIRNEKALVGTIVHAFIDRLVSGEEIDLNKGFDDNGTLITFEGEYEDNESS